MRDTAGGGAELFITAFSILSLNSSGGFFLDFCKHLPSLLSENCQKQMTKFFYIFFKADGGLTGSSPTLQASLHMQRCFFQLQTVTFGSWKNQSKVFQVIMTRISPKDVSAKLWFSTKVQGQKSFHLPFFHLIKLRLVRPSGVML